MSAVSNSVMPRSIALWITLREVSRSVRWPKLLQPRRRRRHEGRSRRDCEFAWTGTLIFEGADDLLPNAYTLADHAPVGRARRNHIVTRTPRSRKWSPMALMQVRPVPATVAVVRRSAPTSFVQTVRRAVPLRSCAVPIFRPRAQSPCDPRSCRRLCLAPAYVTSTAPDDSTRSR